MAPSERAPLLDVVLTKGSEKRIWHIGQSLLVDGVLYIRTDPGSFSAETLPTSETIEVKRREFEAEIAAARADGWQ